MLVRDDLESLIQVRTPLLLHSGKVALSAGPDAGLSAGASRRLESSTAHPPQPQ